MNKDISISIAKAIAIMLMVLGHSGMGIPYATKVIYAFHMPLFFILSGLCFKEKYLTTGWKFCKRKILGIYWPYIKWSIPFLLLHNVCYNLHIYDANYGYLGIGSALYTKHDFLAHAGDIFLRMEGHEQLLGTFWFLKQLLFGSLLFYAILRICQNRPWITLSALTTIAMIMRIFHLNVPFVNLNFLVPYSAVFIAIGYLLKTLDFDFNKWYVYACCAIFLLIGAVLNPHFEMESQSKLTLIPYILPAISGSLLVILTSRHLATGMHAQKAKSVLVFIGDHTLEIMALHFLSFKLISLLIIWAHQLPIEHLAEFPIIGTYSRYGWWIGSFIVGVGLPLLIAFSKIKLIGSYSIFKRD